jgi:hypothetical protein
MRRFFCLSHSYDSTSPRGDDSHSLRYLLFFELRVMLRALAFATACRAAFVVTYLL